MPLFDIREIESKVEKPQESRKTFSVRLATNRAEESEFV